MSSKNMYKILFIGVGQLGLRKFSGLKNCHLSIEIEIVDTNPISLAEAKKIGQSLMTQNRNIFSIGYFENISEISREFDVVLINTNSDVRFSIFKYLTKHINAKYIISEKVLFQDENEYDEIEALLEENGIQCWVNHTRRIFPFYKLLKEEVHQHNISQINITGGFWGIGCNGLHFIDLISYLTDSTELKLYTEMMDDKIYETKRAGFIEFGGQLSGVLGTTKFNLITTNSQSPHIIELVNDNQIKIIDEQNNITLTNEYNKKSNWQVSEIGIIKLQSELIPSIIEQILLYGKSELPDYKQSKVIHKVFISKLLEKYKNITGDNSQKLKIT